MVLCSFSNAQVSQAPVTTDELQYLRFMLMNLASLDHDAKATEMFEDSLVKQFGLTHQESALIHAAGQRLTVLLKQLRLSSQSIARGKSKYSAADAASLSALSDQREQLIETLTNEILNSVRPETASKLRTPGRVLSRGPKQSPGGK
jgi:hypothetical protein